MNKIERYAAKLMLPFTRNNYNVLIQQSMDKQSSYQDFLELVLESEMTQRIQNSITNKTKRAKFPYLRTFEELQYDAFPLDIANKIRELQSLSFIDKGQNVIFVGNPGVGKTHTSIALGVKACMAGKNVLYVTVPNLITELKEAMTMHQLSAYKKKFVRYDLVILDELGYISFDKQGSELLFNLLSMRNDTKSMIITTNLSFNKWDELFSDTILTTAMVDRLTHKAHVLNIQGDSYRIKETKEWLDTK